MSKPLEPVSDTAAMKMRLGFDPKEAVAAAMAKGIIPRADPYMAVRDPKPQPESSQQESQKTVILEIEPAQPEFTLAEDSTDPENRQLTEARIRLAQECLLGAVQANRRLLQNEHWIAAMQGTNKLLNP